MKKKLLSFSFIAISLMTMFAMIFTGCSSGDDTGSVDTKTIAVTSVTLNKTSLSLKVGANETLNVEVKPDDATDKTVTWSSSATDVATVENGKVTAKKAGTTTITATAKSDTTKKATCSVTVTAPATQYTVKFDLNGGSGTVPASITQDSGTSVTLPTPTATKEGFKFNGWAETNNATSGTTGSYTVSKNVTLYAIWLNDTVKTYKVSFMNGTTEISSNEVPENTSVTKPTDPVKENYTFVNWYSDSACTTAFNFSSKINAETKVYAKFTPTEYTITYKNADGSTITGLTPVKYTVENTVTLPALPAKDNYTADGWYDGTTKVTSIAKGSSGNKVFVAKYTATSYSITYKNADGSTISGLTPASYTVEDTVTLPNPTKDGYTFKGWYADSGLSTAASTNGMSGNKTFYAKWEKNGGGTGSGATYTLTASSGNAVNPDNYFTLGSSVAYNGDLFKTNSSFEVTFTTNGEATVTVVARAKSENTSCGWKISKDGTDVFTSATYSSTTDFNTQTATLSDAGTYKMVRTGNEGVIQSITVTEASGTPLVKPTNIYLNKTALNSDLATSTENKTETLTAILTPTDGLSDGWDEITWTTSNSNVASLSATSGKSVTVTYGATKGSATITAKTKNNLSDTCSVKVVKSDEEETNVISASDIPLGFAGVNYTLPTFSTTVTVRTRNELMSAIGKSNTLIYIDGMIDMSDEGTGSKLPAEEASNIAVSSVMDNWIASKTSNAYKTYAEWVEAYAAVCTSTSANDKEKSPSKGSNTSLFDTVWALNKAWQTIIEIKPKSNTTIIGLDSNSGIRGGTINISGVSNVVIRNLTLIDAIDMFPHHEYNDGFNAQFDCITIQGSNTANIWIDHCTMKDTLVMQHVKSGTKEKWQNYDGLCDIKGDGKGITVSNCHMYHHDKTMLVGSSDDEGSNTTRKVSIINNHFDSCVQRLPMARNSQFHVLNNWYSFDTTQSVGDGKHQGDYCIGARKGALIISEANYFDSNMQYSIRGNSDTASTTKVYDTGSVDKNSKKTGEYTAVSTAPFTVPYTYTPMTATEAKTYVNSNAGAGKWPVQK